MASASSAVRSLRVRLALVIAVSVAVTAAGASWLAWVVLVRANVASVLALQERLVAAIFGFVLLATVTIVVIFDLLAMRLVYRPMLLNESLKTRVGETTAELEERNRQLVDSYSRVFALREQLANAEQLASVGQTAANVAHQVGTPLNLISGYVQLLKEEIGGNSALNPRLALIEEQIAKVTATVRTLLDRSRQMGAKSRTTAGELIGRVCDAIRPSLDAAKIALNLELAAAGTPLLVDATNLELSLLNLMTNAIDAMPNGGILTISLDRPSAARLRIEVSDTGHGIPSDLLPRIFDPWVSTKPPGRGTGLGLSIARDVVSAHGGSISVASEIGRGTTFTIELPADAMRERPSAVS